MNTIKLFLSKRSTIICAYVIVLLTFYIIFRNITPFRITSNTIHKHFYYFDQEGKLVQEEKLVQRFSGIPLEKRVELTIGHWLLGSISLDCDKVFEKVPSTPDIFVQPHERLIHINFKKDFLDNLEPSYYLNSNFKNALQRTINSNLDGNWEVIALVEGHVWEGMRHISSSK